VKPPEGASPEERAAALRRNYVRSAGYATVRPSPSKQDTVTAKPGTFGRNVLRDETASNADTTWTAYLVRVLGQKDPAREEMSPERWGRIALVHFFGDLVKQPGKISPNLTMREGSVFQVLGRFLEDIDWARARFELRTNTDLSQASTIPSR
jgi:hypothetical protein